MGSYIDPADPYFNPRDSHYEARAEEMEAEEEVAEEDWADEEATRTSVYAPYAHAVVEPPVLPSDEYEAPFVYAGRRGVAGERWRDPDFVGKWLLFARNGQPLDDLWLRVVAALDRGELAVHAKVSTMWPNPHAHDPRKGVICVYTDDYRDERDVRRVAEALTRACGLIRPFHYKPDLYTYEGRYAGGDKPTVLYTYRPDTGRLERRQE